MSRLPIKGDASLVYGSSDGGKTCHFDDPVAMKMMNEVGEKLNLKPHSPKKHPQYTVKTPIDLECHKGMA